MRVRRGNRMAGPVAVVADDVQVVAKPKRRTYTAEYKRPVAAGGLCFPDRFGAYEDAEAFCQCFFPWYNTEHRHGAIRPIIPHDIHHGLATAKWQQRAELLRRGLRGAPGAVPARDAGPAGPTDDGVDQQARRRSGRCSTGGRVMTVTHKFPMPTVSSYSTSTAPRVSRVQPGASRSPDWSTGGSPGDPARPGRQAAG